MRPVWGIDDKVRPLVLNIIGLAGSFANSRALGFVDRNGVLVGGCVFHGYDPVAGVIEVSAASLSRHWATKEILREITRYAFDCCGCQAIVGRTAEDNQPVRRLWRALGAQEHVIPRLRGRDKAEAVLVLTEEGWKASKFAR